jgi:alkylation response protein AidB-like acyl-CoA dehydrogenase
MAQIPTDEQEQLRAAARSWLERNNLTNPLVNAERGRDIGFWQRLNADLGAAAIAIPEEYGGLGGTATDLAVLMEETGRVLLNSPLLATSGLATAVLLECADEDAKSHLLPRIAAGATATVTESGGLPPYGRGFTARVETARWFLDGDCPAALDGASADIVIVAAETRGGLGLFAVERPAPGLSSATSPALDSTRELAALSMRHVAAESISLPGEAGHRLEHALSRAISALAAEQIGGADAVFDQAIEYAQTREQFGRVIGSFQAVKHKCVDLLVELEGARSTAIQASASVDCAPERLSVYSSLAKAVCSDAYLHLSRDNIQIHGGIGFTWEHSAHLHYRRSKTSQLLFGSPAEHRARIAREIAT